MNLETKITIYKFTPQLFTLTPYPPTLSIFLQVIHTFHIRKIVVLIKKMYFCTNHESNDA